MSLEAKILITDAMGMVGFQLIKDLFSQGQKVRVLKYKNDNFSHLDSYKNSIEIVEADLLDVTLLEMNLQGIEQVYHCKELISFHPQDEQKLYDINIVGTRNLVNIALGLSVKKIVFLSSTMAFGTYKFKSTINEKTKWVDDKNNNNYCVSKHQAELEIHRGQEEGLETIILNPSLILGDSIQKNDLYHLQNMANAQYRFYPKGINGFVKVADVSKACIELMESSLSDEKFIVSAQNLSYQTVLEKLNPVIAKKKLFSRSNSIKVRTICRINSIKSYLFNSRPFLSQEIYNFNDKDFKYDGQKICKELGFKYSEI